MKKFFLILLLSPYACNAIHNSSPVQQRIQKPDVIVESKSISPLEQNQRYKRERINKCADGAIYGFLGIMSCYSAYVAYTISKSL